MKAKRIIPILMIVVLCLSGMLVNANAQETDSVVVTDPTPPPTPFNPAFEIVYDDDTAEIAWAFTDIGVENDGRFAVQFTPPYTNNWLVTVRFYIDPDSPTQPLKIHVLDSSFTELITPLEVPVIVGWNDIDVSSYGLVLTGDFYIALEWTVGYTSYLGYDTWGVDFDRSWIFDGDNWLLSHFVLGHGNFLIRAGVEEVPGPVIPELPLGTITGLIAVFLAFGVFLVRRKSF